MIPTLTQGADIDAFYLGDVLRALGCNCTNATVMANGGTERTGKYNVTKSKVMVNGGTECIGKYNIAKGKVMGNLGTERIGKHNVTKGTGKVVLLS